jgi:hypothetical protein
MVRGSPENWSSDSSDSDSDFDDKVEKRVAKNDEDVEEDAEQVPPWIRYMPRNDWTMPVEIPRDRVSGDNGAILAEYVERAGDFGSKSKAIITKPIPKSSNPFSAEKVLTRARVRREALAVKSSAGSAGAGAGAHDGIAPSDAVDGRGYVAGRSGGGGGGRVRASAHKGAHRVNPYDTYGSASGRPALQRPKASVYEATALLDMWNVKKGD